MPTLQDKEGTWNAAFPKLTSLPLILLASISLLPFSVLLIRV